MRILENSLHIWKINLPADENLIAILKKNLSSDEVERSNQFYFQEDKVRYITSRGILRKLLGRYLNAHPNEISFDYNVYGKPYLEPSKNLHFNVSHSKDYILIAFHNAHVGIDIEYCKLDLDFSSIAKEILTDYEYKKFSSLPCEDQANVFYCCWARKEAVLKAIGIGLSFSPKQFEVLLDNNTSSRIHIRQMEPFILEENNWTLLDLKIAPHYMAAVATRNKINNLLLFDWDHNKIIIKKMDGENRVFPIFTKN